MIGPSPSRRTIVRLILGAATTGAWLSRAIAQTVQDRGIGGTGVSPGGEQGEDRGIGGTGVVGTIRQLGSIVVNDLRINVGQGTTVTIDGHPASIVALQLGHVVRVVATQRDDTLSTQHIAVINEVVGRITALRGDRMTVMGQTVAIAGAQRGRRWKMGDHVAVGGLRQPDGLVVASWVTSARRGESRVTGMVEQEADGALRISGLRLDGGDPGLVGQRAVVIGTEGPRRFVAARIEPETDAFARLATDRFSIETVIEKDGRRVRLGSGLPTMPDGDLAVHVPEEGVYRAIVTAQREPDGRFVIKSVRIADRVRGTGESRSRTGAVHPRADGVPSGPPGGGPDFASPGVGPGGVERASGGNQDWGGGMPAPRSGRSP